MPSPWYAKACTSNCPCGVLFTSATPSPSATHYHVKRIHADEETDDNGRYVSDHTVEYHKSTSTGAVMCYADSRTARDVACELNDANDDSRDNGIEPRTVGPVQQPSWLDKLKSKQ